MVAFGFDCIAGRESPPIGAVTQEHGLPSNPVELEPPSSQVRGFTAKVSHNGANQSRHGLSTAASVRRAE